jgi:hypothetical protein
VRRSDSRSFKIPYPDAVAETLQVRTNVVSGNFDDSRYVFTNHPTRFKLSDQARKFRPEIPCVSLSSLPSRHAEGLTRESSINNVNWCANVLTPQLKNVLKNRHVGPMLLRYRAAKRVYLAEGHWMYPASLRRYVESADPGKQ